MKIEDVHVDLKEMEAFKRRNFEDRLDWIDFKVRWMREHGQIIDPPAKRP